jgi:hypothetical protein
MSGFFRSWQVLLLAGVLAAGCGRDNAPKNDGADGDVKKDLLSEEPAGAQGVIEARKHARDGDEVVVVGRIGGAKSPWIEGRAGFWIVDPSFKPCNERDDDDCKTPWDYCCDDPDELRKGTATVKFVDEQGKTVQQDARKLLGLKELQTVVVQGKAKRDEKGNLTILASGIYRRSGGN